MGYCIQPQLKRDDSFSVYEWGHPTAEVMESIDLLMERQWEKKFWAHHSIKVIIRWNLINSQPSGIAQMGSRGEQSVQLLTLTSLSYFFVYHVYNAKVFRVQTILLMNGQF